MYGGYIEERHGIQANIVGRRFPYYSKHVVPGAILSFGAGASFGWVFGKEIANHTLRLYKFDCMDAQLEFFEWWGKKSEGRS